MKSLLKKEFNKEFESKYIDKFSFDKYYKTTSEYSLEDNQVYYYVRDNNDKINRFTMRNYDKHFKFFLE